MTNAQPEKGFGYRVATLQWATTALSLVLSLRNPNMATLTLLEKMLKAITSQHPR
jgi:hypothetical protein